MTKRKPKKPYTVEWRAKDGQLFRDWSTYSRYKTEKDRDKGLRALAHSGCPWFEFRAGQPKRVYAADLILFAAYPAGSKQKNNYVGDDMNAMQAMMDGLSVQWQRERAAEQMTLGGVIDRLSSLPQETVISGLGELDSYRGYYCDLAFDPNGKEKTAAQLLKECKAAMGAVFTGYKGGEYQMGKLTPLWVASYGCCGEKLMAINDDGTLQLAEDD